jgi:hypothetical protein
MAKQVLFIHGAGNKRNRDGSGKLIAYLQDQLDHSRHDEEVPFAHLGYYQEKLPQATARALDGHEHSFTDGLPELVDDIKHL